MNDISEAYSEAFTNSFLVPKIKSEINRSINSFNNFDSDIENEKTASTSYLGKLNHIPLFNVNRKSNEGSSLKIF